MKKILILGASGLVGKALVEELSPDYWVYGTYNKSCNEFQNDKMYQLDVLNIQQLYNILQKVNPDIVISCLRGNFDSQLEIHRHVALFLSNKINGRLAFCSTGNVFDGSTSKPHYENDIPNASSDYGKYKIDCEGLILQILKTKAIILRLPMIWGKNSPRLTMLLNDLKDNKEIDVPANVFINNNTDVHLAKQIKFIIENDLKGVFHLGTTEAIEYSEFIKDLIQKLNYKIPTFNHGEISEDRYYLAVLPSRKDMPESLSIENKDILEYISK